jgi:hypothetical protein
MAQLRDVAVKDLNTLHYDVVIVGTPEDLFRSKDMSDVFSKATGGAEGIMATVTADHPAEDVDAKAAEVTSVNARLIAIISDKSIKTRTDLFACACRVFAGCTDFQTSACEYAGRVQKVIDEAGKVSGGLSNQLAGEKAKPKPPRKKIDELEKKQAELCKSLAALDAALKCFKEQAGKILAVQCSYSRRILITGDRYTVTLVRVSRDDANAVSAVAASKGGYVKVTLFGTPTDSVEFYVLGGFKTDFSSGVCYSKLVDQDFGPVEGEDADENPVFTVAKGVDADEFQLLPVAFAHFYCRGWPSRWVQPALSFGLTAQDLTKGNVLFGTSLLIGDRQRWVLTWGVIAGKVKRLKPRLNVGDIVDEDDVVTTDQNAWSQFLSLTYNW